MSLHLCEACHWIEDLARDPNTQYICPKCGEGLRYFGREAVTLSPKKVLADYDLKHPYNPIGDFVGVYKYYASPQVDVQRLELEDTLKYNPTDQDALYAMARLSYCESDSATSRKLLQKLLDVNPNHAKANEEMADLYIENRDYVRAIPHLENLLEYNAESFVVLETLGRAYVLDDQLYKGLKCLYKAYRVSRDEEAKLGLRDLIARLEK